MPNEGRRRLNPAQALAVALIGGPTLGGLAVTFAAAFHYLPALGATQPSLAPWRRLLAEPGLAGSLRLTLGVGFAATALSLLLALSLLAVARPRALAPLLASPHSALAIGLAFLIAPSGWIARALSPWATGWTAPPDIATVGDDWGVSLTLGLIVKETPFLIAVGIAALRQFPALDQMRIAQALGYGRSVAFALVTAPQLYGRIRWPVYAVLAYSLSSVDMALILAPSHPSPLSLLALRWLTSPDLDDLFPGEAAAILQLMVTVAALVVWRLIEGAAGAALRARALSGARGGGWAVGGLAGLGAAALALGFASLAALAVWAFAWRWPFPAAWPPSFTSSLVVAQIPRLAGPLGATLALGLLVATVALALAVGWLEAEDRLGRRTHVGLVTAPLLLPQIGFLFGVQILFAASRLDGSFAAVAWAHLLFVFPYVWLTLADPWRALDRRYIRAAASLGVSPWATLARVKLPILLGPLALAFAVGFAVSAAQYLATLFAGGGRVSTLTTEALALAGGGDRRLSALLGLSQTAAPLALYAAALALPRVVYARRRGLCDP